MNPPPEELARHICAHTLRRELHLYKRKRLQLEANGDHNKAGLLSMNPMRKSLILLESKISSLRGAKRRGHVRRI
jgi:hypothetical protein